MMISLFGFKMKKKAGYMKTKTLTYNKKILWIKTIIKLMTDLKFWIAFLSRTNRISSLNSNYKKIRFRNNKKIRFSNNSLSSNNY